MAAFGLSMWRHVNAFVYDHTSKVLGLASSHTGIMVLFGWQAEFYSVEQIQADRGFDRQTDTRHQTDDSLIFSLIDSGTEQRAGSHIRSCWLLWHYMRGPSLCTHYLLKAWARPQLAILAEYEVCVNMCKHSNYEWLCKSTNRNWWSPRQGSMWSPPELIYNGLVHMRLKWRRSSIESKRLRSLKDLLWWNLRSIDVYNTLRR